MFSANENIVLLQHKKRVVGYVEATIPENLLDLGTNVMVMQVTCNTPNCVPIETNIIIIFPKLKDKSTDEELLPGLFESKNGGSYKTKVLKPLADVTNYDVLNALPPAFIGGTRSIEKLCIQIRDQLFGQITQLFDDGDDDDNNVSTEVANPTDTNNVNSNVINRKPQLSGRYLVAQYIQECLQQYMDNNCIPPEIGQPYPTEDAKSTTTTIPFADVSTADTNTPSTTATTTVNTAITASIVPYSIPTTGNVVIPRPIDSDTTTPIGLSTTHAANALTKEAVIIPANCDNELQVEQQQKQQLRHQGQRQQQRSDTVVSLVNSTTRNRQQASAVRILQQQQNGGRTSTSSILQQLAQQHAPGIRRPGCPCCDSDSPANAVDLYLSQT